MSSALDKNTITMAIVPDKLKKCKPLTFFAKGNKLSISVLNARFKVKIDG